MTHPPTPAGLQNERTALAWQRTALSLLAAAAALTRLTYDHLGPWSLVCVGIALPCVAWVFAESRTRYRHGSGDLSGRGGTAPLVVAGLVLVLGATELAALILQ